MLRNPCFMPNLFSYTLHYIWKCYNTWKNVFQMRLKNKSSLFPQQADIFLIQSFRMLGKWVLYKKKEIEALSCACAFGMKSKTNFSWMGRENKYSKQHKPMKPILMIFYEWTACTNESFLLKLAGWLLVFQILLFSSSGTIVANFF